MRHPATLLLTLGLCLLCSRHVQAQEPTPPASQSLAVYLLEQLNEREQEAYEKYAKAIAAGDVHQVKQELQSVVDAYDKLISDSPEFAPAYVSYGLMLNRIGEREPSYAMFIKADKLDPSIAVVKNQLGNYMAEEGKFAEAYGFFLQALQLNPKEPLYHSQVANVLLAYKRFFLHEKIFTPEQIDAAIQKHFKQAWQSKPDDLGLRFRYAQSFFDVENPDWVEALEEWQRLAPLAGSDYERQIVWLFTAKARLELKHHTAARKLLDKIDHPDLQNARQTLLEELEERHPQ